MDGEENSDRISPPSPSLSIADSSIETLLFLGAESDTRSELVGEGKREKKKNLIVSEEMRVQSPSVARGAKRRSQSVQQEADEDQSKTLESDTTPIE